MAVSCVLIAEYAANVDLALHEYAIHYVSAGPLALELLLPLPIEAAAAAAGIAYQARRKPAEVLPWALAAVLIFGACDSLLWVSIRAAFIL